MINQQKLVSVIIPTYNCARYISDAIDSVINQTYKNIEIIIIDDGSTDDTKIVLEKYNKKIKYIYQQVNKGPASPRNEGIKISKGEYVAFLDADDLWEKEKLEKSIVFMDKNNFDWICTALKKTTMEGELLDERKINQNAYGYNSLTGELYDIEKGVFSFSMSLPLYPVTMVIKRICFEKVGLLDESLWTCDDTDLCLRFQEFGFKGGFLNQALSIYRFHSDSTSKTLKDELKDIKKVGKKQAERRGFHNIEVRKSYANLLWELAARYYVRKKWVNALRHVILSLFYYFDVSKIFKVKKYLLKLLKIKIKFSKNQQVIY